VVHHVLPVIHTVRPAVNVGYACLLFGLVLSCSSPFTPVSQGVTGYVSDRAWEIDAELQGVTRVPPPPAGQNLSASGAWASVDQRLNNDLQAIASILNSEGRPLFLDRAFVQLEADHATTAMLQGGDIAWHARVQSLATTREVARGPGAYFDDDRASFRRAPAEALRAAPDYAALAADGLLSIGALFGQMGTEGLTPTDDGFWSRKAFEQDLLNNGYRQVGARLAGYCTYETNFGSLRVQVDVAGPELFTLLGDVDQARNLVRSHIAQHEVAYINGHSLQDSLDAIGAPDAFASGEYRILALDLCWSYHLYTRSALNAAPRGQTHIVNATGRVVTGSVESISALMHTLAKSTARERAYTPEAGPAWIDILRSMNELADARALARRGQVKEDLQPAEIYGVSGVWNPDMIAPH
jgi:hypothetical protein